MQQIVILGGGAAGLAAALAAAQSAPAGAVRVTVLDRNPRCGKKLLATGNGRCNLDNTGIAPEQYFTADPAAPAGRGGCRRTAGMVRGAGPVHPHR